jgi:hypothetical protein
MFLHRRRFARLFQKHLKIYLLLLIINNLKIKIILDRVYLDLDRVYTILKAIFFIFSYIHDN